jgi:hypothetical protein
MNVRIALTRREALRALDVGILVLWSAILGTAGFCGITAWNYHSQEIDTRIAAKECSVDIASAERDIGDSRHLPELSLPVGLRAIDGFQNSMQAVAAHWKCNLTEFRAASQTMPYSSRFNPESSPEGWVQIDVQATLRGTAPNIVNALQELSKGPIPHELNAIEMRRLSVEKGEAKLDAALELRIVTRKEGASK